MNENQTPSAKEIYAQLERIVASEQFFDAVQRIELLQFLVVNSLKGRKLTEKQVSADLFPTYPPPPEYRIVSVVTTAVRKQLKTFYDMHPDDVVLIEIPKAGPRSSYHATFRYRLTASALKNYQLGTLFAARESLSGLRDACKFLELVLEEHPSFAAAYAAHADASFRLALTHSIERDWSEGVPFGSKWFIRNKNPSIIRLHLEAAKQSSLLAIKLNPLLWRPHLIHAAVLACHFEWELAGAGFRAALALEPVEASIDPLYCAFLAAIGRSDDARAVADSRLKIKPGDPLGYFLQDLLSYVTGTKSPEDMRIFAPDWGRLMINLRFGGLVLDGYRSSIVRHLHAPVEKLSFYPCGMKQFGTVKLKRTGFLRDHHVVEGGLIDYLNEIVSWSVLHPSPLELALVYMSLAAIKLHKGIPYWWLESRPRFAPKRPRKHRLFNKGTSTELKRRAVTCLGLACDEHDPVMAWVHLWPLFDSLHDLPEFEDLISRLHLPKNVTSARESKAGQAT